MIKFRYWLSTWLLAGGVNVIPDLKVKLILSRHLVKAAEEIKESVGVYAEGTSD